MVIQSIHLFSYNIIPFIPGPSKKMVIIISDNVRSCVVRGNDYDLGRPFSFMNGCIKYNCDCHSDGSWVCPADRAEDTCQHGRERPTTTDRRPHPTNASKFQLYYYIPSRDI